MLYQFAVAHVNGVRQDYRDITSYKFLPGDLLQLNFKNGNVGYIPIRNAIGMMFQEQKEESKIITPFPPRDTSKDIT